MTQAQLNNWLEGFIARARGEARPSATAGGGLRRQGWDAADKMLQDRGGY